MALAGLAPGKSVSRGRAFRPDSCPDEKASTSMSMPASRPCRPRLAAAQGSEKRPLSPTLSPAKRGRGSQEHKQKPAAPVHLPPSLVGATSVAMPLLFVGAHSCAMLSPLWIPRARRQQCPFAVAGGGKARRVPAPPASEPKTHSRQVSTMHIRCSRRRGAFLGRLPPGLAVV